MVGEFTQLQTTLGNVISQLSCPQLQAIDSKQLGARMGAKMKAVAAAITQMDQHQITELEKQKSYILQVDGEPVTIEVADVDIIAEDIPGWSVANKDNLTVALDITVSEALQDEGNARELVNRIQRIRKDSGLELTDRIVVTIEEYEPLKSAIINFSDYICTEILADKIDLASSVPQGVDIEVNEATLKVLISKTS
ncbi:MAG: hypothetical protein EOP49_37975 [Sphingobacteriales bacterium]|nr:MAG: hypothetical protein EOP49_37975 [Sphingobacteriales bacterium]